MKDPVVKLALDTLEKKKQALVFVNSKRGAEKQAEDLAKTIKVVNEDYEELSAKATSIIGNPTAQCNRLAFCLKKGIAFHHAGLHSKQKALIEDAYRDGVIKVICATPTLCLSAKTEIWTGMGGIEAQNLKKAPVTGVNKTKSLKIKPLGVKKNANFEKLIEIESGSGHRIRLTRNHRIFIKRNNRKSLVTASKLRKSDKIATLGQINIKNTKKFNSQEFIKKNEHLSFELDENIFYLIGVLLGDGYSGAETKNNEIIYKGAPSVTGIDAEIFLNIEKTCKQLGLFSRRKLSHNGVPNLMLSKKKWFREFLVNCGVEKGENKYIAQKLLSANKSCCRKLLQGLFDTDGYVELRGGIGFSNTSLKLVKQAQRLLLRLGIVSRIRTRKPGSMKIYNKTYKIKQSYELLIYNKKSVVDFYRFVGFGLSRKEESLMNIVAKILSNYNFIECKSCKYKVYRDVFSGRIKIQKEWGNTKKQVIKILGDRGELGSNDLKRLLKKEPRAKENRLNRHYEFIQKRKIKGNTTEWYWSLNLIGEYVYRTFIKKNKNIKGFIKNTHCPLCSNELFFSIKKGRKDSDFEGDIYWDQIRTIKTTPTEKAVYDVVLPNKPNNEHLFVAEGIFVHNSAGLDLPAYRAILRDVRRYGPRGMAFIPVLEYLQMVGRCGRPKYDTVGEGIVVAKTEAEKDEVFHRYVLGDPESIYSKLAVEPVLRTYLLSLIAAGFVRTKEEIMSFFRKTFWAHQFKDMAELERIVGQMLQLLESWDMIVRPGHSKKDDFAFISGNEILEERFAATILGKRVSELYLDPLTAHEFVEALKRAGRVEVNAFSFMHLISNCLEMRPQLNIRVSEWDLIQEQSIKYASNVLQPEPSLYEADYDQFLKAVKTALMFMDWMEEIDEQFLLEKYNIRPGETRVKLQIGEWLLNAVGELARVTENVNAVRDLAKVKMRFKYGVKEELLPLLKFRNVGRVRARKLFSNNIKTVKDVEDALPMTLSQLVGPSVAKSLKEQVGQKNIDFKFKKQGQYSLRKYERNLN